MISSTEVPSATAPTCGDILKLVATRHDLSSAELVDACLRFGKESKDSRGRAKSFWVELRRRFKLLSGPGSRKRKIATFGAPSFKAFLMKHRINSSTVYYLLGRRLKATPKKEFKVSPREVAYLRLVLEKHPGPLARNLKTRLDRMHDGVWGEQQ